MCFVNIPVVISNEHRPVSVQCVNAYVIAVDQHHITDADCAIFGQDVVSCRCLWCLCVVGHLSCVLDGVVCDSVLYHIVLVVSTLICVYFVSIAVFVRFLI